MRATNNKLSQAQETIMIKDLQRVLPINELQAREILMSTNWNLQKSTNTALDLQNKGAAIEQQFNRYLSKNEQNIVDNGIVLFCNELGIDIMDPVILYISYIFKAEKMGVFTKFDFLFGFTALKIQSTIELRSRIGKLREELFRIDILKSVYKYCFDFAKGKKDMDFQVAQGIWETLLKHSFPIMNKFLEFTQAIPTGSRNQISKDTYNMIFEFCTQIGSDLTKYDYLTGAWPTFIDEFYFYVHPEHKPRQ